MPEIALQHATLDYQVVGPQDSPHPPVLFIHGALVDHRLWTRVADRLAAKGFRCILPTLPLGSHTIPIGGADLSPRGIAAMIRDLIDALGLHDVTLVGNDTGGALCQIVADSYPEHVGRLILTNCDAFEKFPPFPFNVAFLPLRSPVTIKAAAALLTLRPVRHSPLGYGLLTNDPDPALTRSWITPCATDQRIRRDAAALMRGIARTNLTEVSNRMNRFTKPVSLVWGQADRCFTPALGRRLADRFAHATMIPVPGAKTFVPLDNPAAVADAVASIGARAA